MIPNFHCCQFFDRTVNRLDMKHPKSYLDTASIFYGQIDAENPQLSAGAY